MCVGRADHRSARLDRVSCMQSVAAVRMCACAGLVKLVARLVGLVAGHGGRLVRAWVSWWAGVERGVRALRAPSI